MERVVRVRCELACFRRIAGGVGQLVQNGLEELSRRLAREGDGHDAFRLHLIASDEGLSHDRDIAVGELPGLPRTGGGQDQLVVQGRLHGATSRLEGFTDCWGSPSRICPKSS